MAQISATSSSSGKAGAIKINTVNLNLFDGALISSSTFDSGAGGDIEITSESIQLKGVNPFNGNSSQILAETQGSKTSGNVIINNTKFLSLRDGGQISTSTKGEGAGGEIKITSGAIELVGANALGDPSGILSQSTGVGKAGKIAVTTNQNLSINDRAKISATSSATGDSGDIAVNADRITLKNDGAIEVTSTSHFAPERSLAKISVGAHYK